MPQPERMEIRRDFALGKPIAQQALVRAILRLQAPNPDGARLSLEVICKRINDLDWSVSPLCSMS